MPNIGARCFHARTVAALGEMCPVPPPMLCVCIDSTTTNPFARARLTPSSTSVSYAPECSESCGSMPRWLSGNRIVFAFHAFAAVSSACP